MALALAAPALLAAGCTVQIKDHRGLACDDARPCVGDEACWLRVCTPQAQIPPETCDAGECTFGSGGPFTTGTYVGNGIDDRPVQVGFEPGLVMVKSNAIYETVGRSGLMPGTTSKPLRGGTAGGLPVDAVQALSSSGFTVGTAPEVNEAGVRYHWLALRAGVAVVRVGSYVGDGVSPRHINATLESSAVLVMPENPGVAQLHLASMPAGYASALGSSSLALDAIDGFSGNGFVVGPVLNANNATYHYVTWKAPPAFVGSYVGDGTDGRRFDVGFRPGYVLIKGNGHPVIHRTESIPRSLDEAMHIGLNANRPDAIQAFTDDGFVLGTDPDVNEYRHDFYYLALPR